MYMHRIATWLITTHFVLLLPLVAAHADHIYHPTKTAYRAPSPRICLRTTTGDCSATTIGLDELKGDWHGNLSIIESLQFLRYARESGLCKGFQCHDLSPYMSLAISLQDGRASFILKTFNKGSASSALVGRNALRLNPTQDGFMIRRHVQTNSEDSMQIRMQLVDGATQTLQVKILVRNNVIAHGTIAGPPGTAVKPTQRVAEQAGTTPAS